MRRTLSVALLLTGCVLTGALPVQARGLLIPVEKSLPPLAMLDHKVSIGIEDQVATTKVEQTFRNHTDRQLEATYIFPVPKGASVNKFTMLVDGKETKGEMVPADRAREIYTSIVRRTQDPGLLEYMGHNLFRLRVFPIPAHGDQKISLSFTSVADKEDKLVEYIYPLKTDGKAVETLEKVTIEATVKSQSGVTNVYSPTHGLALRRVSDKEVKVSFEKDQGSLDRDFQMYYSTGKDDVGLTLLTHRPVSTEKGFFTVLISPKLGLSEKYRVPRDLVLVLDTSGSMRGPKMEQAPKALRYCLSNLHASDRFALVNFATTVSRYEDRLIEASSEQLAKAGKWVDELEATGGTAINEALQSALELRPSDDSRPFTVVFFTDGLPTIGETDADKIFKNFKAKNSSNTRVFTFGVGDDVNASLLDRVAESTRGLTTYVRPEEHIEQKVSALYSKISHPVLTSLKLSATTGIRLSDVYPVALPDLFHNGQLVVMGRFDGKGSAAVQLTGRVGKEEKLFAYDVTFPERTDDSREHVEHLWARRKVGYLLDEIRVNGEKKELKDEVVVLAKRYGITTPYTSYLIVPDGVAVPPVARVAPAGGFGGVGGVGGSGGGGAGVRGPALPTAPPGLLEPTPGAAPTTGSASPAPVLDFARKLGDRGATRERLAGKEIEEASKGEGKGSKPATDAREKKDTYDKARELFSRRDKDGLDGVQTGRLGVDLAIQMNNLRNQARVERVAQVYANGRQCLDVGGVWVDDGFQAKSSAVVVKAQSEAYFRILEKHPKMKSVFKLGNYLVWMTPSGTALVVDANKGSDQLTDVEIDKLFAAGK